MSPVSKVALFTSLSLVLLAAALFSPLLSALCTAPPSHPSLSPHGALSLHHPLSLHPSTTPPSLLPPPTPATFTPALPQSLRWPPPTPASGLRGAVFSLYTGSGYSGEEWLRKYWRDNEKNFFAPFADHVHWVILYLRWPHHLQALRSLQQLMAQQADPWGWRLLNLSERVILPPGDPTFPLSSLGDEYITPLGARVLLYPFVVNLPQFLADDPGQLDQDGWAVCGGRQGPWDLDYIMYSGAAYNYHLLSHPITRRYDYFIKMDLDNHWIAQPPMSPFGVMASRQCLWMHSNKGGPEDCARDAYEAAMLWASRRRVIPRSEGRDFMHVDTYGNFAGNFLGGWMGWLGSQENLDFAHFLYHNQEFPGYFQRRWGDQPAWSLMLGMFHNLTENEFLGRNGTTVCDLESWRGVYFKHKG